MGLLRGNTLCVIGMQQQASDYDDFNLGVAISTKTSGADHGCSIRPQ